MRVFLSLLLILSLAHPVEASLLRKTNDILSSPLRMNRYWGRYFIGLGLLAICDEAIESEIRRSEDGESIAKRVSFMGKGEFTFGFIGLSYGLGYYLKDHKLCETARLSLESNVIAGCITVGLKIGIGRYRPFSDKGAFAIQPFRAIDSSFPSGHTSMAFSLASVFATQYSSPVPEIAYTLATLVAISRVYLSRHWSSDVWTGALLGWGVGKAVVYLDKEERVELYPTGLVVRF